MSKPKGERYTVAVDFDGVIHSYTSPWTNARTISDGPVDGAIAWLVDIASKFDVAIFTTRNHQLLGKWAVRRWLRFHLREHFWPLCNNAIRPDSTHWTHADVDESADRCATDVLAQLSFPTRKPPALIYLDDRAYRFEGPGTFPTKEQIHAARPWNKRLPASKAEGPLDGGAR